MPVKGLTQAEIDAATAAVVAAGGKSTDRTNRLPGETATEANARITAAYKNQPIPEVTKEGKAAGATMEFVRTGAGGVGTYKEIYPMGTAIPQVRTKENGNVFDPSGTLIPGSTPTNTATSATGTAGANTASTSTNGRVQQLPPGFIPGAFPKELEKFFGQPPADIMGYKITEYTNAAGQKYSKLSISQKGAYGTAVSGSSEFGAPITKGPNGEYTLFQGDYSTGSNIGGGVGGNGTGGTGGTSGTGGLYTASDGKTFTNSDSFTMYQSGLDEKKANKVSAYNLLYDEFDKYGLGTLVSDIKNILVEGSLDPAEFSLKVRGTDAYKARFIANEARLAKGLKALSPAQYIALEDQYQEVMRQYGLPESYYAKSGTGVQEGFRKLIENDVSNIELEDRISTAQKRVLNANPEVTQALKQFYPDITNADILAYTLDPKNAIENIKRKVTAAEIGGAAIQSGLQTGVSRAEQLGAAGVTKDTAEKGFGTIAGGLQRGSQLASIYGENPYTQTTAEQEVFGLAGKTEAEKQRKKLTGLEKAAFGGQTGLTSGALVRDRAGAY